MGRTYGVATDDVRYRTLTPESDVGTVNLEGSVTKIGASGGTLGFYGLAVPIAKQTITQLATTKTTTQLRAEVTAIENALAALGIITVD